ncbi:MAG: transcription-repair coupling factor [Oligoflexales bacterium]
MKHCNSLKNLADTLQKGQSVDLFGIDSFLAHIITGYCVSQKWPQVMIVLPKMRDINVWSRTTQQLNPQLSQFILPNPQLWGLERYQNLLQIRHQRLQALSALAQNQPGIFFTTWSALCKKTIHPTSLLNESMKLTCGQSYSRENIISVLAQQGYISTRAVHHPGQFLFRGGILEIFPLQLDRPLRILFFDEEITHIQYFSTQTRQVEDSHQQNCFIPPAYEKTPQFSKNAMQSIFDHFIETKVPRAIRDGILLHLNEGTPFQGYEQYLPLLNTTSATSFDYINKDVLWVFPQSLALCEKAHQESYSQLEEYFEQDTLEKKPSVSPKEHFLPAPSLPQKSLHFLEANTSVQRTPLHWIKSSFPVTLLEKNLDSLWEALEWLKEHHASAIFCGSLDQIHRFKSILNHRDFLLENLSTPWESLSQNNPTICYAVEVNIPHSSWKWLEIENRLLISIDFLLGKPTNQTKHHKKLSEYLTSLKELHLNDIVVHPTHGLGQYMGTHHFKTADGTAGDYVELMYQNNVRMYVPVEDLKILARYGNEGSARIDKIHGAGWNQRKSKAKKAIHDLAEELLNLQAKRTTSQPIRVTHQSEDIYRQFEGDFPWQETEDQLRSLQEIDHDLTSGLVMDRLLVGDVGFGKTEIAMRAAMKTILSGYQVIVLVPTTILCQQHERSFHHRMNHYGITVKRLDRSIKTADTKKIESLFKTGRCDVLISTHRILSKQWPMSKVGLVIIDEEQRFGVSHKEKLKSLRSNVHILSMTATPIPRTLHMSMVGLREISLIETPPKNRQAIQTEIKPFSSDAIRDSIYRELDRDGQVFIIYNRVTDIERVRHEIERLVPNTSITIAHGQMSESSLDKSIQEFLSHKTSILLCTTIVESGIDMPNVNTLIVYEAQRFGLSQLHQIRGRVGRSHVQAFALFLTRPPLSDEAQARLNSLLHHQELNAGFAIASQDLEQRGAGDLLGSKQSGHIGAVGLSLYTSMLEHAISELKGESQQNHTETELQIGVKPVIPRDYINTDLERLKSYRRIFDTTEHSTQQSLQKELEEHYGPMPEELHQLFTLSRIRSHLGSLGVIRAKKIQESEILLYFHKGRLQKALQNVKPSPIYEVTNKGELRVFLAQGSGLLAAFEAALAPLS